MRQICENEKISIEEEALELLAQMADGSLRDALSLLDQCAGNAGGDVTEASVRGTLGLTGLAQLALWLQEMDDLPKSMGHLDALYQAGMDVAAILGQLSSLLRDLLMGQMLSDLSLTRLPPAEAETLSAGWPRERILRALSQLQEARLSRSGNKKLEAELCLIRLACLETMQEGKTIQVSEKPAPKPVSAPKPGPVRQETTVSAAPEAIEAPETSEGMIDAARDHRWTALLNSVDNLLLRDALSKSGAKVDGDRLVVQTDDPFVQGVLMQAEKQIAALYPGQRQRDAVPGVRSAGTKTTNRALDALIASAGDLVIEE